MLSLYRTYNPTVGFPKYELNERNDIEFIQNQMGRRRVKHKKMKMVKEV